MKSHYLHPTGFALGLTSAALYTICAILIAWQPQQTLTFINMWLHGITLQPLMISYQFTIGRFLTGLISITLAGYITGALFAFFYQRCETHCKRRGWI